MTNSNNWNLRSEGQLTRHADVRKAKEERRLLAYFLARHELALENLLGEVRATLDKISDGEFARNHVRGKVWEEIAELDDEESHE